MIFRPETVIGWQRAGFRMFWRWKSRRRRGRPGKDFELIRLIRRMWAVNPTWGSPRTRLATDPETMLFSGASLDQWRLRGRDLHSLIADPMFIAPKKWISA